MRTGHALVRTKPRGPTQPKRSWVRLNKGPKRSQRMENIQGQPLKTCRHCFSTGSGNCCWKINIRSSWIGNGSGMAAMWTWPFRWWRRARRSIQSCAAAVSTGGSTAPPTNSNWPRCWSTSRCPRRGEVRRPAEPRKVQHRSWRAGDGIRAWNRRSMRWKVMAWNGCARMAGKASNAPSASRSTQPTCIGWDGCCSNGRRDGTIARTTLSFGGLAVPVLNLHPSRPLGTDPACPDIEQEHIIHTFGAPVGPSRRMIRRKSPTSA